MKLVQESLEVKKEIKYYLSIKQCKVKGKKLKLKKRILNIILLVLL